MKWHTLYYISQISTTAVAGLLSPRPPVATDAELGASGITQSTAPPGDARLKTVYQFPNLTWVENIAVRNDGKLLVTLINTPDVYIVDPIQSSAELVYSFPAAVSTTGIAEIEHGTFAVIVGNWSDQTLSATRGSWSVWTIDYATHGSAKTATDVLAATPMIEKVTDIPEAYFLNGATKLLNRKHEVLVGDSGNGVVYRVNTQTRSYTTVIDSPALKPNASAIATLGVNGIHTRRSNGKQYLYFTNSFSDPMFGRFQLNHDGTARGEYETIVARPSFPLNNGAQADDFTFDYSGQNAWITTDPSNTLVKASLLTGNLTVEAGGSNDAALAGCTAAAFGRTQHDAHVLYVVTNGGLAAPPPGGIVGGKIIALNTHSL